MDGQLCTRSRRDKRQCASNLQPGRPRGRLDPSRVYYANRRTPFVILITLFSSIVRPHKNLNSKNVPKQKKCSGTFSFIVRGILISLATSHLCCVPFCARISANRAAPLFFLQKISKNVGQSVGQVCPQRKKHSHFYVSA